MLKQNLNLLHMTFVRSMWIKRLLKDLQTLILFPIKLYCHNKDVISITHNPILHDKTKYVKIDKYFIKKKFNDGLLCIPYIPTYRQVVDIFTKRLPKN
uniref:Copia protein n=1 Tax=Rhizophora mucronata TaxID=61149 RepID=A0A2P2PM23_RHIMU